MIEVKKTGVLFTKTDLEFENEGVLNPVVIREDEWELHGEVNNVVFPTGKPCLAVPYLYIMEQQILKLPALQ